MTYEYDQAENGFSIRVYQGDARTLLAFNLTKALTKNLAGFSIQCAPDGKKPYYLFNTLRFEKPQLHAQVAAEPSNSIVNAPIHKFCSRRQVLVHERSMGRALLCPGRPA